MTIPQNQIDVLPGTGSKVMLCIAGWATGPALFEAICSEVTRLVVTPFNPVTVADDVGHFLRDNKMEIHQIMGVSMGVPLAVQCSIQLGLTVPIVGIGSIVGYARTSLDAIRQWIDRSLSGYLRSFWKQSVGVSSEMDWIMTAFQPIGWTKDHLDAGLLFMESPWESIDLSTVSISLIHGGDDQISRLQPLQEWASEYQIKVIELAGVGHLPFGEISVDRLQEVLDVMGF